jgi:putative ABC transport system permease protein
MVKTLDRKLLRDLWQVKAQIVTIALVVASGISAFVASLSTYDSLHGMQASYYDSARFGHVFAQLKRAPTRVIEDLIALPGVAEVNATLTYDVLLDLPEVLEPMVGRLIALPERGEPSINRLTLMAGRWPNEVESNQVLVNETFGQKRGLMVGDHVTALLNGKHESMQIVGIVLSPEYILPVRPGIGDESSFGIFWIGRKRLAAAYNMEGAFNQLALRLAHGADESRVVAALDRVLAPYGSTGAYGRAEQLSHRALTQEINEQKVFGTVLPSVFLGVAMFLLNVVLTRQIGTQRGQIAALKALGRPDHEIALHYLKFVLVIVLLGSVLGLIGGWWLGEQLTSLYARFFHFPNFAYRLAPWIALVAVVAAFLGAVAGALHALLRVVRLAPAEAMRPESPPSYRRTLVEVSGLGRLVTPRTRMILRDLERRPARALFTTVGIAAALAILISGTWWGDAIDYLIEIDFRLREREQIGLQLTEIVPSTAHYDLAHLPGVIKVEADRQAPVRLHHGHRSYRTVVMGLTSGDDMRQLLDRELARVPLPVGGVILNERLARRLHVAPGDRVQLEFLQGSRTVHDVVVRGLVDEKMAMQVYMERTALNRLTGDGDVISGARLLIDIRQREKFFRAVKATPGVASVIEIDAILRHFRETSARNILVFTTVLTVLAGTIAVGVVYNQARIALAERAWELASLRVLGATRAEVSTLLLGELALELVIALPLGWTLGYWLSVMILALIIHDEFEIPLIIHPSTYAYATIIVLLAGVFSALIVRRRIDRLDLVAVLKVRD